MKELVLTDQLKGLEKSKADQIEAVFAPMVTGLKKFEKAFDEVVALEMSPKKIERAKRLRLDISRVRIDADKVRKIQKEEYLRAGNAIQGVYNILKFAVADKEDALKEIETHYEKIEIEKKNALKASREAKLLQYDFDGSTMDLGNMADDIYTNVLAGARSNYETIKASEKKAEEDRIENERKEKLYQSRKEILLPYSEYFNIGEIDIDASQIHFDSLLKEARENKSAYDNEQEKIRADNERLRIENEKAEKKRIADQKKQDALQEKADAKFQAERIAREKLERENNERLAREKEESDRKAAADKKAANAPDIDKLKDMSNYLLGSLGTFKSDGATAAIRKAIDIINSAIEDI